MLNESIPWPAINLQYIKLVQYFNYILITLISPSINSAGFRLELETFSQRILSTSILIALKTRLPLVLYTTKLRVAHFAVLIKSTS